MTRPCGNSDAVHGLMDSKGITCRRCEQAKALAVITSRANLAAQATNDPAEALDYDLIAKYDAPPVHNYADEAYERAVLG